VIARITLDLAVRRDFDYSVPAELEPRVVIGARVKAPFGAREVAGVVTEILETSPHANLRPLSRVLGELAPVTPKILALARWIAEYYCCPVEVALKAVLPENVRREEPGWRERLFVTVAGGGGALPALTKKQEAVWRIVEERRSMPLQELIRLGETTADTVRRLESKGLLVIAPQRDERDPYSREVILPTTPLVLNPEQSAALKEIVAAMDGGPAAAGAFLLHGVTGSGKTEIYLQAIDHALSKGRGAIVLVPEISLTPQTVERFKARFSAGSRREQVAVLHSRLSAGERHDEWQKIRRGNARIVIGARSAIFAPVDPLGLVIVDEEHEHSYKQEESPRYHARDVAVVRSKNEGAVVVLGSATPSMESYFNANKGKYRLLKLTKRVTDTRLPIVRVVDLRHQPRDGKGGPAIFSRPLADAMHRRLERGEQTMLFLNRRGYAASLQCEQCGYVAGCPHCSLALTFHRGDARLRCHLCGHEEVAPTRCPEPDCGNPAVRFCGLGTERVFDALQRLLPKARIRRMDSDTLKRKDDFRHVLDDFRTGKIDILVGTQMIAKGLHFPNVTLVGIIHADLSLHVPDFRAGERTFQLLTQVSGRAGRGDVEGEVFVQTFTPFHPAIQFSRRHDYEGFYDQELEFRTQLSYPPLARVALVHIRARDEDKAKFVATHLRKQIDQALAGWKDLRVDGPAPAPLARAEGWHRYHILLRTPAMAKLSAKLAAVQTATSMPDGVSMTVDIDPVNLM
jgi:primosomal protein N' (replication factor Y) (superfamily II helicase)